MKRSSHLAFLALTGLLLTACGSNTPPGDTTAPTIRLAAAPNPVTAAGDVTLTAAASDNVAVTKVTFYRGNTEIGSDTTAPYELKDAVTAAQNGDVVYRAVATDAAGNTADAAEVVKVSISTAPVDTAAPTVKLTAAPSTVTAAGPVTLTADATDDVGVVKVTFYRGATEIGSDTTAPYTFSDSVTAANNGSVAYRAVATDAAGKSAESTATVTVNIDVTKPTVSLKATPAVVAAAGKVALTATASDNVAVTKVTFYRGTTELGTDTTAPYTFDDSVTAANNGTLNYRAVAADAAGNTAEATASVKVDIDPNEPNDSVAAATALTVGKPINGSIAGQPRDMDYFKFEATEGDKLMLTVKSTSINPASTLDPYVRILLADGKTVLEKDDDGGAALESEIRFNVPATGTYYVALTSFDIHDDAKATDDKTTNTYQIALTSR